MCYNDLRKKEGRKGKKMKNIAIYVDLENANKAIDFNLLYDEVKKSIGSEVNFSIKVAVGNQTAIKNAIEELSNHNFDVKVSKKNGNKKNKADLIISLDAIERLIIPQPNIDAFVFITSDSDFTVVMSKLKKYDKYVLIFCSDEDLKKDIFLTSANNVRSLKSIYYVDKNKDLNKKLIDDFKLTKKNDPLILRTMLLTLSKLKENKYFTTSDINQQFRKHNKTIKLPTTQFGSFKNLYKYLAEKDLIIFRKNKESEFKVPSLKVIKDILGKK